MIRLRAPGPAPGSSADAGGLGVYPLRLGHPHLAEWINRQEQEVSKWQDFSKRLSSEPYKVLGEVIQEMQMIIGILEQENLLSDEERPADAVARVVEQSKRSARARHPSSRMTVVEFPAKSTYKRIRGNSRKGPYVVVVPAGNQESWIAAVELWDSEGFLLLAKPDEDSPQWQLMTYQIDNSARLYLADTALEADDMADKLDAERKSTCWGCGRVEWISLMYAFEDGDRCKVCKG